MNLARKQRWSLTEARALLGWSKATLWRWMRKHRLAGKWLYAKQLRRHAPAEYARCVASDTKRFMRRASTEENQALSLVAAVVIHEGARSQASRLKPHDDAYFHRQHFLGRMSLRLLARLHDLTRDAVDLAVQRHGRREHAAQVAELRREAARRATGT